MRSRETNRTLLCTAVVTTLCTAAILITNVYTRMEGLTGDQPIANHYVAIGGGVLWAPVGIWLGRGDPVGGMLTFAAGALAGLMPPLWLAITGYMFCAVSWEKGSITRGEAVFSVLLVILAPTAVALVMLYGSLVQHVYTAFVAVGLLPVMLFLGGQFKERVMEDVALSDTELPEARIVKYR